MDTGRHEHSLSLVATAPICLFVLAAWLLAAISPSLSLAQEPPSNLQPEMRMYRLPLQANSADISPDERFVAIQTTRALARTGSDEQKYIELLEVWDFRRLVMVQDSEIAETNEPVQWRTKFVRYTGDGEMLVTYVGDDYLRILRASDLQEIGRINLELNAPRLFEETEDAQFMRKMLEGMESFLQRPMPSAQVDYVGLCGLEVAPALRRVAILVCLATWPYRGELRSYDLEAQSLEGVWTWNKSISGGTIAWRPDGKKVALLLSTLYRNTLLVVDGSPVANEIKADPLVSSVAFTSDDRLLTVSSGRVGLVFNKNPKMRVLDAESGKQVKKLGSPLKKGVKYHVAASADSTRVVAYTNIEKAVWDWWDMLAFPVIFENRFTVWEWPSRKIVVTSPDVPEISGSRLRLSSQGHLVLASPSGRKGDIFIFEIP